MNTVIKIQTKINKLQSQLNNAKSYTRSTLAKVVIELLSLEAQLEQLQSLPAPAPAPAPAPKSKSKTKSTPKSKKAKPVQIAQFVQITDNKITLPSQVILDLRLNFKSTTKGRKGESDAPVLQCLNFQTIGNQLKIASTNGHYLNVYSVETDGADSSNLNFNIYASDLAKVKVKKSDLVIFEIFKNSVNIDTGKQQFNCCIIDYPYPNYPILIPNIDDMEFKTIAVKENFADSLKPIASAMVDKKEEYIIRMLFNVLEQTIELDLVTKSNSNESLVTTIVNGHIYGHLQGWVVAVNARYLLDIITLTPASILNFHFDAERTKKAPIMLTWSEDTISYDTLLMPIELKQN